MAARSPRVVALQPVAVLAGVRRYPFHGARVRDVWRAAL